MLFMKGSLLHRFDVLLFHSSCLRHVSFSFLVFFCVLSQRIGHNRFRLSLCKRLLMEFLSQLKVSRKSETEELQTERLACLAKKSKRPCDGVASTTMTTFYNQTVVTADCQGAFAALRKPVELIWKLKGDCVEEKTRPPPAPPSVPPHRTPRHFRLYSRHMFNY